VVTVVVARLRHKARDRRVRGRLSASRDGRRRAAAGGQLRSTNVGSAARLGLPAETAARLTAHQRILLFCAGSGTSGQHARFTRTTVNALVLRGLISPDAAGYLGLTDRGRAVLRAMLTDL
jgi:hypothetical protein